MTADKDIEEIHNAAHKRTLSRLEVLELVLEDLVPRVEALEAALRAQGTPRSEPSSAPTTGPAEKPSEWFTATPAALTVSQRESLGQYLMADISASFSLRHFISPLTEFHWTDGQTLQVTCLWPIGSGGIKAGSPGRAGHDDCTCEERGTYVVPSLSCPVHGTSTASLGQPPIEVEE